MTLELKNQNEYFLLFLLLGGICGISIWLITDKDIITEAVGMALFSLGLCGLFYGTVEMIVKNLKSDYITSKPSTEKSE